MTTNKYQLYIAKSYIKFIFAISEYLNSISEVRNFYMGDDCVAVKNINLTSPAQPHFPRVPTNKIDPPLPPLLF